MFATNRVKESVAYETTDGKIFEYRAAAESHQKEIDFRDWYEDNKLYGTTDGSKCDAKDVMDWLRENNKVILYILKEFRND